MQLCCAPDRGTLTPTNLGEGYSCCSCYHVKVKTKGIHFSIKESKWISAGTGLKIRKNKISEAICPESKAKPNILLPSSAKA